MTEAIVNIYKSVEEMYVNELSKFEQFEHVGADIYKLPIALASEMDKENLLRAKASINDENIVQPWDTEIEETKRACADAKDTLFESKLGSVGTVGIGLLAAFTFEEVVRQKIEYKTDVDASDVANDGAILGLAILCGYATRYLFRKAKNAKEQIAANTQDIVKMEENKPHRRADAHATISNRLNGWLKPEAK